MNNIEILTEPYYISGAFLSQSRNLSASMSYSQRQEACFLATVASFIKKQGATCFASPETILATFNKHAAKFSLKLIRRTTLFSIQKRVIAAGLVGNTSEHDAKKGRHHRKLSLNIELIAVLFSGVMNQAIYHARACITRKLNCGRSQESTTNKSSNDAGSSASVDHQKRTITTKESKDLSKNRNKKPDGAFFKKRFGKDCDLAYQLQEQARNSSISASGAKKLISLHHKHNVNLAPAFKAFLNYRIFNAPAQGSSKSTAQRSQQRLQAALEVRQGNQAIIEPELAALLSERPEPSQAQRSKNRISGILEQRKAAQGPVQSQPQHLADNQALSRGMALRERIQKRIKK